MADGRGGVSGVLYAHSRHLRNVNRLDDSMSDPVIVFILIVRAHHNHQPRNAKTRINPRKPPAKRGRFQSLPQMQVREVGGGGIERMITLISRTIPLTQK